MQRETVTTFRVCYKANPDYDGDYNVPSKPGFQGPYDRLAGELGAREGVKSCKRWFNEEKIAIERTVNGQLETSVKTIYHDNVICWIERYVDGILDEAFDGKDQQCEPESPISEEEPFTSSTAKKSRKLATSGV